MVADLAMHGIVPRKTCSTKPAQILPELARHYWRGVLDGDGSISRNGQVKLTLVGDDELVLGFEAFVLAHCPRVKASIFRKLNRSTFRITDAAAIRMLEVLYGEAHVYLDRNYERAQTVL